ADVVLLREISFLPREVRRGVGLVVHVRVGGAGGDRRRRQACAADVLPVLLRAGREREGQPESESQPEGRRTHPPRIYDPRAMKTEIDTERLTLRLPRREDFAEVARMWANPEVTRFIGGKPLSEEDV